MTTLKQLARLMLRNITADAGHEDCNCVVTKQETITCGRCEAEREAEEAMDAELRDEA